MDRLRTSVEIVLVTFSKFVLMPFDKQLLIFSPSITRRIIIQNRVTVAEMICRFIRGSRVIAFVSTLSSVPSNL